MCESSTGVKMILILRPCLLLLSGFGVAAVAGIGELAWAKVNSTENQTIDDGKTVLDERQLELTAKSRAKSIQDAVVEYQLRHDGDYPDTIGILTQPDPEKNGQPYLTVGAIRDPWGQPYQFQF